METVAAVTAKVMDLAGRALPSEPAGDLGAAVGRRLAVDVRAEEDLPPFDRSMVDGYAVGVGGGPATPDGAGQAAPAPVAGFRVVGESAAGRPWEGTLQPGEAVAVMTGAPVPAGTATVVMVEHTRVVESGSGGGSATSGQAGAGNAAGPSGDRVTEGGGHAWAGRGGTIAVAAVPAVGKNVAPRGSDLAAGRIAVPAGVVITPAVAGALAAVGCVRPAVVQRPRVVVLPTGDELVPASSRPDGGRIRNSNGPMLAAAARSAGAMVDELPPATDTDGSLRGVLEHVLRGRRTDVLIVSGGVSAGRYDLVPAMLERAGVRIVARAVAMRPGKPLLVGRLDPVGDPHGDAAPHGTLVFGLPGNPVSSLVCFELFVRPALRSLAGDPAPMPVRRPAVLAAMMPAVGPRETYWPGRFTVPELSRPLLAPDPGPGKALPAVTPLPWQGSADLFTVAGADVLLVRPAGAGPAAPGESVTYVALPSPTGREPA